MDKASPAIRDDPQTRQRLLDAAEAVFGAVGFHDATVRDICERAGANVAAVNYHFGNKEQLYAAVCESLFQAALTKYPPILGLSPDAPAEQRLAAFVRSFVYRMLDPHQPNLHKFIIKEMAAPTRTLDRLVERIVQPLFMQLRLIIRDLLDPSLDLDDWLVVRTGWSVISQCQFYRFAQPVITRLRPDLAYDGATIDAIADHVTRFSLGGIYATRDQLHASRGTRPDAAPNDRNPEPHP